MNKTQTAGVVRRRSSIRTKHDTGPLPGRLGILADEADRDHSDIFNVPFAGLREGKENSPGF